MEMESPCIDDKIVICSFTVPENLYKSTESEGSCNLDLLQTLELGARYILGY